MAKLAPPERAGTNTDPMQRLLSLTKMKDSSHMKSLVFYYSFVTYCNVKFKILFFFRVEENLIGII